MSEFDVQALQQVFRQAPFIAELGAQLDAIAAGECSTSLAVQPRLLQQHGYVHAGVQATLADHSMGVAAFTMAPPNHYVVTVEFKMSLLRPAQGDRLICRAKVLKPGKQFTFTEAEVFVVKEGKELLTMKASATMAVAAIG